MRVAVAVSLDGYLADPDGGVDWLNPYFSPEIDFDGFMQTIGATVMGRTTYCESLKLGMPPGAEDMPCVVLSHRPLAEETPGIEAYAGDLATLVERLRRRLAGSGKDIWHMGGGASIDAFRAAGLIDRYELSVMPITLGRGIPLFPAHARDHESLRLTHSRTLSNGMVELWYEPTGR